MSLDSSCGKWSPNCKQSTTRTAFTFSIGLFHGECSAGRSCNEHMRSPCTRYKLPYLRYILFDAKRPPHMLFAPTVDSSNHSSPPLLNQGGCPARLRSIPLVLCSPRSGRCLDQCLDVNGTTIGEISVHIHIPTQPSVSCILSPVHRCFPQMPVPEGTCPSQHMSSRRGNLYL